MSIMPEGGWHKLPQLQDDDQGARNSLATQSSYAPRRSHLTCKICDRGTLESKTVFRMSGPAVVIGFIHLIPSIIGMVLSLVLFVGIIAFPGVEPDRTTVEPNEPTQSAFDAGFRQSCAASVRQKSRKTGSIPPQSLIEQYCECALPIFRETGSVTLAGQTCNQKAVDGTLETPTADVHRFYVAEIPVKTHATRESNGFNAFFKIFGGISAISLGIACFVGGLLDWLLVMRKHILQCDICNAVVNAS
jgi:hypothetical protein